ncbi:MAG: MerR family transcriptional regulator [Candidatus Protistobacter heckmanni]|nr:MerR family transcriptional regulator [Candidatus Protistobacter heckmanni]
MAERAPAPVALPPIPAKRYFTIGEVSELCAVKPHVLRYWEQEFAQLKPVKRRGNRRYYQHHEVLLIRRIRELLYEQGFTISGARNRLDVLAGRGVPISEHAAYGDGHVPTAPAHVDAQNAESSGQFAIGGDFDVALLRKSLTELLSVLKS